MHYQTENWIEDLKRIPTGTAEEGSHLPIYLRVRNLTLSVFVLGHYLRKQFFELLIELLIRKLPVLNHDTDLPDVQAEQGMEYR